MMPLDAAGAEGVSGASHSTRAPAALRRSAPRASVLSTAPRWNGEATLAERDPCGVLLIDKPAGKTSHDVVAAVRRDRKSVV